MQLNKMVFIGQIHYITTTLSLSSMQIYSILSQYTQSYTIT
jgi:hypothetical protein